MQEHHPHLGGIIQCRCGATVQIIDGDKYAYTSGKRHLCRDLTTRILDDLTGAALRGEVPDDRVSAAVAFWLDR
jgi:hypothetical protein